MRRLAALQMPSTDFGLEHVAGVGIEPSLVSIEIGTWIAIEWMFSAFVRVDAGDAPAAGSGAPL